jgi:hypothetical protein
MVVWTGIYLITSTVLSVEIELAMWEQSSHAMCWPCAAFKCVSMLCFHEL